MDTPGNDLAARLALRFNVHYPNRGLPPTALTPGNKAIVVGFANRNKPEEMRAERITIDGKTVELR